MLGAGVGCTITRGLIMIRSTFKINHDSIIRRYVDRSTIMRWFHQTFPNYSGNLHPRDMVHALRCVYAYDLTDVNLIKFYGQKDYCSNWYPCTLHIDGHVFFNVEQYMMWRKALLFKDMKTAEVILHTSNPKECKRLGREVKGFDARDWDEVKYSIVLKACKVKFSDENPELLNWFKSLDKPMFVECSPTDVIWGIGLSKDDPRATDMRNWKGQNLLGRVLTEVWDDIKNN